MTDSSLAEVSETVRERIDPGADERARLAAAVDTVVDRAERAIAELPVDADVVQVGSTARGTWLSGDRDIDVFVRFDPDLPRDELERYGLEVGHAVLPDGREEYAEHPYVTGVVDGFDVDLVPCYGVAAADEIRSAVDRSPFHTAYLESRLTEALAAEVRLAKAFCTGIGVYGSDLRTRGLSGYLVELLVLEYGGFEALLSAVADWQPPVELDPEGHGSRSFDDPLVVIDPTDPGRNVAAVTDAANVARLQHHARALLAEPTVDRFEPTDPGPLGEDALLAHLERRGTTPIALRFPTPDLVEDQLYPQLERSRAGIAGALERRGFEVLRDAVAASGGEAICLFDLAVASRPRVERHEGPPVHVQSHATGFYETYAADDTVYGPFVDGERYVVERYREFTTARAFLESDALATAALGADLAEPIVEGSTVLEGAETAALLPAFGAALARFFQPVP